MIYIWQNKNIANCVFWHPSKLHSKSVYLPKPTQFKVCMVALPRNTEHSYVIMDKKKIKIWALGGLECKKIS